MNNIFLELKQKQTNKNSMRRIQAGSKFYHTSFYAQLV